MNKSPLYTICCRRIRLPCH